MVERLTTLTEYRVMGRIPEEQHDTHFLRSTTQRWLADNMAARVRRDCPWVTDVRIETRVTTSTSTGWVRDEEVTP